MTPSTKLFSAVTMTLFCFSHAALADPPAATDLPVLVADEDLDKLRGGFVYSGLNINFGADIRTYVDGELLLQTVLNWSDAGPETIRTAAAGLTPIDAAALEDGIFANGNIRMKVGDTPVYLINGGRTAISHETENGLQNTLINTARGFNSIQEVDATLNLSGYQDFNSDLMRDRISSALDTVAGQAAIGALGN